MRVLCAQLLNHIWLCDLADCSLPGTSVHGIFRARTLEWVAVSSSRGSSEPRVQGHVSCVGRRILYLLSHTAEPKSTALALRVFWFSFLSSQSTLKHEGKFLNIITKRSLERVSKNEWNNNKPHPLCSGTVRGTLQDWASCLPAAREEGSSHLRFVRRNRA